jgi:hypothetical protein
MYPHDVKSFSSACFQLPVSDTDVNQLFCALQQDPAEALPDASNLADDLAALGIAVVEDVGSSSRGKGRTDVAVQRLCGALAAVRLQAVVALTLESATAWQLLLTGAGCGFACYDKQHNRVHPLGCLHC